MKFRITRTYLCLLFVAMMLIAGCGEPGLSPIEERTSSGGRASEASAAGSPDHSGGEPSDADDNPLQTQELPVYVPDLDGKLQVHYIDVGQGASQLLIGPTGKVMLIDAGDNDKEQLVVEYLKSLRISKVDVLIGTHPHADHIGGLDAVIEAFDIGSIYMPRYQANTKTFEDVLLAVQNKGLKISTAKAGVLIDWEQGTEVRLVAPIQDYNNANEMSAVVHVEYDETSFLFTGDAESRSEADMVESGEPIAADVLLAGHHGSSTSTTPAFLDKVNPSYAVIQSGKGNSYGHPHEEVLQRLQDRGVAVYRNDEQGHLVFISNGKEIAVEQNDGTSLSLDTKGQPSQNKDASSAEELPSTDQSQAAQDNGIEPPASVGDQQPTGEEAGSGGLSITAAVDNPVPKQNSTVTVTVTVKDSNGKPIKGADVKLLLHYKSTNTTYEGVTNAEGIAELSFKIGRAAKEYTVKGDITIQYGNITSEAQVSFTPQ